VACSDSLGSIVAAMYVRSKIDGKYSSYLSLMLLGIAIESVAAVITLLIWWPTEAADNPMFAVGRVIGRSIKSAGVWVFVLYLMNVINGNKRSIPKQDRFSGELSPDYWKNEFKVAIRSEIKREFLN